MTAKDARSIAEKVSTSRTNEVYLDVITHVQGSAEMGKLECFYDKSVPNNVLSMLSEDGYTISDFSSQKEGICYKIAW